MESWKPVKNYEDIYEISDYGNVRNKSTGRLLKTQKSRKGYLRVGLSMGGKQRHYFVHRIVAESFIPNPNKYPQVNHKDEDKNNNCVENLEWCTNVYNCNYGKRSENVSIANSKQVIQLSLNFQPIRIWKNTREPEAAGFNHAHIASCCRNERKTHGGYIWKYAC